MKKYFVLPLMLLASLFSRAQSYVQTFDNFFNSRLSHYDNNVLVVIGCSDNILYSYQHGIYGTNDKLDLQSLSKWVTSAVIMSLVEEGKFSLDDHVGEYINSWNSNGKQNITIKQLLAHTSGLPADTEYDSRYEIDLEQAVNLIATNIPLGFTPGTQFLYGSSAYKVAARVAEVVENKRWKQIFAEKIASLSGMPTATFSTRPPFNENNPLTGNGLECSVNEFSNFMKMILKFGYYNGNSVLDSNSVVVMQTKHNTAGVENYGLGQHRDMYMNNTAVMETWHPSASGCLAWVNREKKYYGVILTQAGFSNSNIHNQDFRGLVQNTLTTTSCSGIQPCEYSVSTSGPSGVINTGASVTLNSTCSGQCSGVSYSWSGNGINGNNTNNSVTFSAPSTAGAYTYTLTASKAGCANKTSTVQVNVVPPPVGGGCVVNKVRFQFRQSGECCMDRLPGAKIQGSNNGTTWTDLYTFTTNGTGSWQEFSFSNTTAYSSVRFQASPTGWGELHELEFYNGATKLSGTAFGTDNYAMAFDGNALPSWHAVSSPGTHNHAGLHLTGCSTTPDPCDFTVSATSSNANPQPNTSITLTASATGQNSNITYTWSGNGISGSGPTKTFNAPATAGVYTYTATASKTSCSNKSVNVQIVVPPPVGSGCVVNKVRFQFRQSGECCMDRLPGAKIQGSNNGTTWTDLYTFTTNGTGSWQEFPISNTTAYSSVRFQASPTGWGELHELEFYNGTTKLSGTAFGTDNYAMAFDGNALPSWHAVSSPGTHNHAGLHLTGCSTTPDPCDFTVSATSSNANPQPNTSITLTASATGQNSNITYTWSGDGISGSGATKTFNAPATAGVYTYTLTASKAGCADKTSTVQVNVVPPPVGGGCVVNKVRFQFRQSGECCMDRLPGAKIQGSNNGTTWTDLYTFTTNGTGSWQEFPISNTTAYSSVRFQASPTGWGELHELEFYNGATKLSGTAFGTDNYAMAFDGNALPSWHAVSSPGTHNHAGLSNLGNCSGSPLMLDMTDLGAINNKLQLSVSPNPSNGVLNAGFYLQRGEKATIVINDLQGRTIYSQVITGNGQHNEKIYLVNKSSGIFTLRLQTNTDIEIRKIQVAR